MYARRQVTKVQVAVETNSTQTKLRIFLRMGDAVVWQWCSGGANYSDYSVEQSAAIEQAHAVRYLDADGCLGRCQRLRSSCAPFRPASRTSTSVPTGLTS